MNEKIENFASSFIESIAKERGRNAEWAVDSLLPEITGLGVDVLAVTGDHSTPSAMKLHSWPLVPLMISSKYCRGGGVAGFSESSCSSGGLGIIKATEIMPLLLAHAGSLSKFGV